MNDDKYKPTSRDDMATRLAAAVFVLEEHTESVITARKVFEASRISDDLKDDAVYMASLLLWKKWGLPDSAPPDKESDEKIG